MKSLIINEKRYEKGLALIVSFCKNLMQRESRGSLVGRPWVVRVSMNRRWSVDGALMEDRWSHDSAKNANMQMCKIANLHFCKSGKAHLARLAATLLMIVTLGVGEVWGATGDWLPDVAKVVKSNETVYCTDLSVTPSPATGWYAMPAKGDQSASYSNVTSDKNGNPGGITDNLPNSSSVSMHKLAAVGSSDQKFNIDKKMIHMRVKGVETVIVHGYTGSTNRGLALHILEVTGSVTASSSIGTEAVSQTRSNNAGCFIMQKTGLDSSKEYLLTIMAKSNDASFYAIEFIAGSGSSDKYYYRGGKNSWGATEMTLSDDGTYYYCDGTYNGSHEFKISPHSDSYNDACGWGNVDQGFNNSDIKSDNPSVMKWYDNGGNIGIKTDAEKQYYIIMYPAHSGPNTTGSAKVCASTELPYNMAAGRKIYFDNSEVQMAAVNFRIGHKGHNTSNSFSKVPGTSNLYQYTTVEYNGYMAMNIANKAGYTNANSIYNLGGGDYAITQCTEYIKMHVGEDVTITPTNNANAAPKYYVTTTTSGMKSHTATITAPSNGTITVAYTDVNGAAQNFTSGNRDLAHTCILTITATPNTGYSLSGVTVNGGAFTSGNTHVLSADATIAATFAAKTTSITINANTANHGSTAPAAITATYGQSLPAFTAAAGVSGYQLKGYYTAATDGTKVINADGTLVASVSGYTNGSGKWIKEDANVTLYAQYEAAAPCVGVVTYDISCWSTGDITGSTTNSGLTIVGTPNKKVVVKEDEQTISGKDFTKKAALEGGADASYRYMSFDVLGPCSIDVYFNPKGNRTLALKSSSWSGSELHNFAGTTDGVVKMSYSYTGSAATLVLGSTNSGIDVYGINVSAAAPATYTVTANDPETDCDRVVNNVREGQTVTITNSCSVSGKHLTGYTSVPEVSGTFNSGTKTYTFTMPASNVTLTAVWGADGDDVVRTITFHDGVNTDTQDVPNNVATALKAMNTIGWSHTGQTFAGWAETEDGAVAYADRADITITADKDLYAKWTKNQYTVTLDNQSATTAGTASVTVTYGSKTNLESPITVPTKTNNEFGGYYTAQNGAGVQVIAANGAFNKDNDYVKADGNWKFVGNVTLYAKWTSTVTTYAITYDANGGSGTMTATREYEAGETVTIKTNAFTAPSGKEFAGWVVKDASNADVTVTDGKFTMPAKNVTIKAQWQIKAATGCNTMVIYRGLTSDATGATSGSESNSGARWAVTNGSSTYETVDYTYDGVNYKRGWKIFGGASSASNRFVEIVIPKNYTGTFKLVGYITSTGRSAFISKKKTESLDKSIAYITPASTKTIVGATSAAMVAGTYYFCVTNAFQITELSVDVCPVAACTAPTINSAEASKTSVCSGTNVTLSASATANEGGALTYQWYKSDNTTAGATGAEITVNPEETTTYYCKVTDANCSVAAKSSTVTVTVNAATAITTQPTAATESSVGETVSLKVVATGSHLSYQWQESADGSAWGNMPVLNATAKQATLSVKVATVGTMYYRCVVTGDCGNETSAAASITAGAATPTVIWSDVTTVYRGEKVSVSVTTNTDAVFDESALTISAGNCTVESKTMVGKTVVAELYINANAAADATITLTFNTAAGASYGATVNNTHTLTVSGDCPAGGALGTVYTATMMTRTTATAIGGTVEVNANLNSGTQIRGGNTYYKFDASSKLTLTPEGGFKVGDVLTIDITSSDSKDDGLIIKNSSGTQLVDLHEKLSSSKNSLLTYTFTDATDYVTMMRHSSACYFYGAYVDRVGSLTNLEWNDTEDMIEDGVVTVVPEAENFTLAAASSNSFGAITYSIAPAGVATINTTTGEIDPTNLGTATVTATIAASGCYGEKSITYTLKVANNCVAPVISDHPASATYEEGASPTALSVTATGSELTYQWYRNNENNNTSGTAISGATSANYTPDVTVRGTTYYYCEVKSGKCGTLSNVATIEVTRPACALAQPKIIEVSREGGDCWTSITLKAVEQNGNALDGGTYQWYLDGEPVSTNVQPTITVAGTYTLDYTKDECTVDASNEFVALSTNPELGQLSPFQYYHAGKSDYSDQMNDRHLFTYISLSDAEPSYTATLNEVAMAGDALTTLQGALERVSGKNNVDTIMLSLNDLVGCSFAAGDEVVITVTPKNCSGAVVSGEAKSIALHVVDARPTLAFIVSGADGAGTKVKKNLMLNGDFLTGYNKADLKVQTALTTVSDAELPLYTALKENYNVVPVNGYAPFSKWNYEPFDLLFLTDFVKSDGSADKAAAKKHVEALGNLVDYRPMFSTKGHMSGFNNWKEKGFTANPTVPKQTQVLMNIVCYAHPMFEGLTPDGANIYFDAIDNNETVFRMLSQGGYDSNKGIQGFEMNGANEFIKIALTHYDAHGTPTGNIMTPTAEADDRTLIASCERQANIEARFIILSLNADATSFLTEAGIDVIIRSLSYLLETNPIKVTDCHFDFDNAHGTGVWSDPGNWAPRHNVLPTKNVDVRISANCIVDTTSAVAASVKVKDGFTLTIADTAALTIQGIAQHQNAEGKLSPTSPSDLVVSGSSTGTGAFIHGDEAGKTGATVQMYSPATATVNAEGTGATHAIWQWITTPYNDVADAQYNYYGAWMYSWDNANKAWSPQVTNGNGMTPFGGYAITQENAMTYTMTGTLVGTANQTIALNYNTANANGLNLIGNSWTAPIDITKMSTTDFTNATANIIMFNTGIDVDGSGTVTSDGTDPRTAGTYVSIPVETASSLPASLQVIPAMQGFEVKATATDASLKLDYSKIVRGTDAVNIQPMRAPGRRVVTSENGIDERLLIMVHGSRYSDFLYLFHNAETSMGFDNGWDGEKMYSDNYDIPVLYVENTDGDWQISTQPELAGTTFGFYKGEDTWYTVSFEYDGNEKLWFYDAATGIYTEVETGNIYSFSSTFVSDDPERRFVLTNYNPNAPQNPGVATGVDDVSPSDGGPRKLILDDKLFILNNGHLYDATGRLAY